MKVGNVIFDGDGSIIRVYAPDKSDENKFLNVHKNLIYQRLMDSLTLFIIAK